MKKKTIFIILGILAIIIIALVILINNQQKEPTFPESEAIAEKIQGLSGEIKNIGNKTLSVEAKIPLADTTKEPIKKVLKIVLADGVRITKFIFPEEIPAEITEPLIVDEVEITFNDLQVGNKIDIGVPKNVSNDIKNGNDIVATHIFVIK